LLKGKILRKVVAKIIFIIVCLLALGFGLPAQSPKADSLQSVIGQLKGPAKVNSMILLIDELLSKDTDLSLKFAIEATVLADSLDDKNLQADAIYHLGLAYLAKNNYSDAENVFKNALAKSAKIKNHDFELLVRLGMAEMFFGKLNFDSAMIMLETANTIAAENGFDSRFPAIYNNMAKIEEKRGNHTQAISLYLQSADFFQCQNNENELAIVFNNISTLNLSLKNYHQAIRYMKLAVEINKKQNQVQNLLMNYINLGIIYMESDSLQLAKNWYLEAINIARKTNDEFQLARTYMSLGNLMNRQSKYEEAKRYYDSSLYLCEKNKLGYGIMLNKINVGDWYANTGDYDKAISILNEALTEITQYNLPVETAELYKLLYRALKKSGNPEKALKYYEMHIALQDSIAGAETKKSILELEHKYEKERSARQIAVLQQNNLSEKAKYRFYTIIFLIVVIILLSAGFNILMRHRKAVEKAALANQENLILKQNMETKSRELVTNALQLAQMNEQFIQVNKQLKSIKSGLNDNQMTEINAAIGNIENNTFAKSWKEFETRYQQVHEGFYGNLQNACPTLTPAEIKICSFLRLNLTTKDIALLTNRTVGTIDNARSSIRKKLNLANDSNLTSFLLSL
jgi:tetratricopeptide (TPR) repeat protein